MAEQIKNLIAKWDATWPSPLVVSRQHDNGQFRINLVDYPEPENYEDQNEEILETINYYLVVWMKQSEDGEMEKLAPIQLPGPYWLVNSPYTQLVQDIKFQFYATSSVTGYIAHSAQFKGMILESLSGSQQQSVIPEDMWDAYKQYIEDKIIGAGLATIDPTLSISGAAADAKATGDAITNVNGRLDEIACAEGNYTVAYLRTLNPYGTWNDRTYTYNGISYTFDDNMNLTVSGTATANSVMDLYRFRYASSTNVTLVNPVFDSTDDVYIAIISPNGALIKYPKGVTHQIVPSGTQRIVVRVESGKTVNATSSPIEVFTGLISDFGLKSNLDNLQSEVEVMENDLRFVDIILEQGSINSIDGVEFSSSTRVRTSYFYHGDITVPVGYKILYAIYYDADTKAFESSVYVNARSATVGRSGYLVRLVLSTTNTTSPVTPADFKRSLILEDIKTEQVALVDDVSDLESIIDELMFSDIILEQGGIQSADGSEMNSTQRVRTSYFYGGRITVPAGFKILYAIYYDASTLAFSESVFVNSQSAEIGRDGYLVRITLSTNNTTDTVTPEDFKRSMVLETLRKDCDALRKDCDANEEALTVINAVAANAYEYPNVSRLKALNSLGTWTGNVYSYNGISYTINSDASITVSGTASGNSSLRVHSFNNSANVNMTLINPTFDSADGVYVCRIASNGALQKYPKGTSKQTIPSGLQRILIRVEAGKTIAQKTTAPIYILSGAINDYLLTSDAKANALATSNYIPYQRYSYSGEILTPSQLKTKYSAANLLEAMYDFCDELAAEYPDFVAKETLQYTGEIVSSVSELPNPSDVANGTIYMVTVSGGYNQYICKNGSWVQMHTWDDNGDPIYLAKLTYPMYAYTITPYKGCDYPVILWCSGLHGSEDWSNVSTLYLFQELLENRGQNDDIDYLLSNFVIKIIPCCGVSACADRTLGAHAMSENGVNPNRDYPVGWEESQDEWRRTGNYPWYDPYNRIIKTYIESLPNVVYCINKHDSNTLTSDGFVNNIWDNYIAAHVVEDCAFKQLDLTIKSKYPWLLSEFVGTGVAWNPNARALCNAKYVYGGTYGTMEKWFNAIGIKGGLIETVCKTGSAYSDTGHDADFYRIALECDVMALCAVSKNLGTLAISDKMNTIF